MHERQVFYCVLHGNARESVFTSDRDKQDFVNLLSGFKTAFGFRLYSFALLESQIHLLFSPLSRSAEEIVSGMISAYARQINRAAGRSGYVLDKTFDLKQCHNDGRLLPLIRYIHYLPVQFGHCHHPNLARWTSHLAYLGDPRYSYVEAADMLEILSKDRSQALRQYQTLMSQSAAGIEQAFVVEEDLANKPQPITLERIAHFVTTTTGVSLDTMRGKGRSEQVVEARRMFIAAAVMVCSLPVSEVAKYLHVHHSYVSRLTFPRSEASKSLQETAKELAVGLQKITNPGA